MQLDHLAEMEAQLVNGPTRGQKLLQLQMDSDFGWLDLAQKRQNALIIKFGRVDLAWNFPNPLPQGSSHI